MAILMTRDVRKGLIWIAAFVLVVLAGDRAFSWLAQRVLVRSQFRYSRLYRGGNDAEIVILGDSRGVNSFYAPGMEKLTGARVLNLSYNSLSPEVAEALLLDHLDRSAKPKIVILEFTSAIVSGEVLTELRPYAGLSPRLMALYTKKHPYAARAGRVFHLLPLNSGFYIEALHYMRRDDQDWIMRSALPPEASAKPAGAWKFEPYPQNIAALGRIADVLRRRGIEGRLIIAPYYRKSFRNMPQFLHVVGGAVHPDGHVRIYNYANAIDDPGAFADTVHLNETGSLILLKMLQRDGVFAAGGMAGAGARF
jgi:hypothetical protein